MTRLNHPQLLQSVLQLLNDEGSDGFAEGLRLLVNEAMQAERSHVLKAQPFERTDARRGGRESKFLADRPMSALLKSRVDDRNL